MTKKQVLFWRIILIFIVVLGGYFITLNIDQIVQMEKTEKGIDKNKNDEKVVEKEIELSIRLDDFFKDKK